MTQKKLIFADKKDKIRMICENLRASDASAFCFSFAVLRLFPYECLFRNRTQMAVEGRGGGYKKGILEKIICATYLHCEA